MTFVSKHAVKWSYMRLRLQGSSVQYAAWNEDSAEPSLSEPFVFDLTGHPSTGYVGVRIGDYGAIYEISQIAVGTEGEVPPAAPQTTVVSGIVRDDSGNPCERVVRAYHRTGGSPLAQTTSDPVTGEYSFNLTTADEINLVFLDANGAILYNDLIHRVIPGQPE